MKLSSPITIFIHNKCVLCHQNSISNRYRCTFMWFLEDDIIFKQHTSTELVDQKIKWLDFCLLSVHRLQLIIHFSMPACLKCTLMGENACWCECTLHKMLECTLTVVEKSVGSAEYMLNSCSKSLCTLLGNKQSVMGTGAGSGTTISGSVGRPGGVIRVYSNSRTDSVTPGSFIPYCSMAQAQLSFHGHKDAVKFFVAVPGRFHLKSYR